MNLLCIICLPLLLSPQNQIESLPGLNDDEKINIIIHLKDQINLSNIEWNIPQVDKIILFQNFARVHQRAIMEFLSSKPEAVEDLNSFWIFNGLGLKTTKSILLALTERDDVDYISLDSRIKLDETGPPIKINPLSRNSGWNIKIIQADSCWTAGYTGADIVVGTLDSGIDTSHAAVRGKWVPGGWFDAVYGYPYPYDDYFGHGLFTMDPIRPRRKLCPS